MNLSDIEQVVWLVRNRAEACSRRLTAHIDEIDKRDTPADGKYVILMTRDEIEEIRDLLDASEELLRKGERP